MHTYCCLSCPLAAPTPSVAKSQLQVPKSSWETISLLQRHPEAHLGCRKKRLFGDGFYEHWSRINQLSASPQPIPTALTGDWPDLANRLGRLTAPPYDLPPHGSDANDARVPGQGSAPE